MVNKFTFGSAGEIQEVEFALARGGFTHPLLKQATSGGFFGLIREVLEGRAEICHIERLAVGAAGAVAAPHIIDCDAKAFEPRGLMVAPELDQLSNRVRGQLVLDPSKVKLDLSPNQQGGRLIMGNELKKELASEPVLDANVLDYFFRNSHFIPKEWKQDANGNIRNILFWGTVYCDWFNNLYVRISTSATASGARSVSSSTASAGAAVAPRLCCA